MPSIQGVLPALITPLDSRGRLDDHALAQLLAHLYAEGAHGVYVAGNTGEGLLLSLELRQELAAAVRSLTPPDRLVVVHVGCANTRDSLALARHAADIGASAVSSLPPSGPFSFAEIEAFYAELAAETALPFLVYFFPEAAPAIRTYAQLERLCHLPNVAGLKFTDFDFYTLDRIKQLGKTVMNGRDEAFACGLLMGADGGIGSFYNIAPSLFADLYAAARTQHWDEARVLQRRINQLISVVLQYPMLPALKKILEWQGIPCGACVPPRLPLTHDDEIRLLRDLRKADFGSLVGDALDLHQTAI